MLIWIIQHPCFFCTQRLLLTLFFDCHCCHSICRHHSASVNCSQTQEQSNSENEMCCHKRLLVPAPRVLYKELFCTRTFKTWLSVYVLSQYLLLFKDLVYIKILFPLWPLWSRGVFTVVTHISQMRKRWDTQICDVLQGQNWTSGRQKIKLRRCFTYFLSKHSSNNCNIKPFYEFN